MKTSSKIIPFFLLIGVIACAVLRFFQYVSIMDYQTGFFTKNGEGAGILIYILMAVIAVIYTVLLIIGNKKGEAAYRVSTDGMGSHATQVLGAAEIVSAFLVAWGVITAGDAPVFRIISAGGIALILLITGFIQLRNIVPPTITGHLKILSAALIFPLIAELYENDLVMIRRSDKLIVILCYVFIGAFLASSARAFSRLETTNSRMRELITAGMAFILCSTHTLPKLIAYAFGGASAAGMSAIDTVAAAGMILSGTFIGVLFFTEKKKEIVPVVYDEETDRKKEK